MDSTVQITIQLGNETMKNRRQLADALRKLAGQIALEGIDYYPIVDLNGNKVGSMEVDPPVYANHD